MTDTIQLKGLDRLKIKLGHIPPGMKAGVKAATLHVKGKIAKYPPTTEANMPKTFQSGGNNRWYQRGWGSKYVLKSGTVHGTKSSEILGKAWTIKIRNDGLTGVIGNDTEYGPYVQDTDKQAAPLKRIGWKTTGQVADEERETVLKFIQNQVEDALRK